MKKLFFMMAALALLAACGNRQTVVASADDGQAGSAVPFVVAKNYFFKQGHELPASPKITSAEAFNALFGMATLTGEDGKPTAIDFDRQFAVAVVLPVTDVATEIRPVKVEDKGDTLFYDYEVTRGEKQSFSIQPVSIIVLDKKYERKEVVLAGD
jgi:hypothetical protein